MRARFRRLGDDGETLLELLVAITILGICVVAIGTGIFLSVKLSAIHRGQSTADAFLHDYAETVQGHYQCSGTGAPNYVTALGLATPTGFNAPTATVKFWNPTTLTWNGTSCQSDGAGLQQVTFKLDSTDGFVSESLVVTVRDSA
jgi:type II secretory pathway pseudopilin PulG